MSRRRRRPDGRGLTPMTEEQRIVAAERINQRLWRRMREALGQRMESERDRLRLAERAAYLNEAPTRRAMLLAAYVGAFGTAR